MPLLCIDIGNSSAHSALVKQGRVLVHRDIPTADIVSGNDRAEAALRFFLEENESLGACQGVAFASVVPAASVGLKTLLTRIGFSQRIYHLRHDTAAFIGFDYPHPQEVGQDRIANVIAARARVGAPAVVIDMGTASTFDVLSSKGYAGGTIAPGLALMTDYLHEKTALLPHLDRLELDTQTAIGKSTVEAMKIGAHLGFQGMIKEMLRNVIAQLEAIGEGKASVITTGGNAIVLPQGWWPGAEHVPDLALFGLEIAFYHKGANAP